VSVGGGKLSNMRPVGDRAFVGQTGEAAAALVYAARGYRTVARNWRCPLGEIDLVITREDVLVFCEVKTRRTDGLGGPFEAVTATKQRRLRALAVAFMASGAAGSHPMGADVRFDVASVTLGPGGRPAVHLFEDAF
jgi:putative endonuclease